jgi:phosphoribosylformimino-5-aminoimidazole carboxamide ribotide isomerase
VLTQWRDLTIEVIPAVDVLGDEAVRLHEGDYGRVVARAADPAELAARFAEAGATRIHLVDLDGARSGRVRPGLVRAVADATGVPVQASGGIRSPADAHALLAAGADRVVVGTAAFPDPSPWVEELGARLVVAIDVRDGEVRTRGWTEGSGVSLADALDRCGSAGVERVLCTAIDRDGTLRGPDLALARRVAATGLRVLAAGGIRSPDDVAALAAEGAEAAIVGRALLAV